MDNLDKIKGLIATGDKQKAIGMLASILLQNKDEAEAWLLLGYLIDDPVRKRDCYHQVLRLFPHNSFALEKLQELGEPPPTPEPMTNVDSAAVAERHSIKKSRRNLQFFPETPPMGNNPRTSGQNTGFIVIGVVGLVSILFVIASAGERFVDSGNPVWGLLMLLAIVGGIFLWSSSNRSRWR